MDTSQYVPYQAYKSKRHSRAISGTPSIEVPPNPSSSSQPASNGRKSMEASDPANVNGFVSRSLEPNGVVQRKDVSTPLERRRVLSVGSVDSAERPQAVVNPPPPQDTHDDVGTSQTKDDDSVPEGITTPISPASPTPPTTESDHERNESTASPVRDVASERDYFSSIADKSTAGPSESEAGPSTATKPATPRKASSFRYVPLRPPPNNVPRTSSPLRPPGTPTAISPGLSSRQFDQRPRTISETRPAPPGSAASSSFNTRPNRSSLLVTTPLNVPLDRLSVSPETASMSPLQGTHRNTPSIVVQAATAVNPPQRTTSLPQPPPAPPPKSSTSSPVTSGPSTRVSSPVPPSTPSTSASGSLTATHKAVYRPGFQPKGVYRPLTDDFIAHRKRARDASRIEQTRLERRLEKLIQLHFPVNPTSGASNESTKEKERLIPKQMRRASSLFELDFNELRSKSPSDLWREILDNRVAATPGGKNDIRAAEQDITPWEKDSDVSACPLCSASFHPLTNRKHHCRICGRIICSLPVKQPQRPQPCSLLFVVDQNTRRIEEVSEGVDYGVRPRRQSLNPSEKGKDKHNSAEEKFLKGVRICRECKPVMLRQQYLQERKREPTIMRLYRALVSLEGEIEEALPQFEEMIINLSNNPDDVPTKEASAARKRLLEAFAEYDAISKRIRRLPCPEGPGSSQDRVQAAILNRANIFLQKNMFPLQSLPKPKKHTSQKSVDSPVKEPANIDPDSQLAHALQPLLEQEALLESFIEEAKAHRKFEDAKTLKANLAEIRNEINRIVANANSA